MRSVLTQMLRSDHEQENADYRAQDSRPWDSTGSHLELGDSTGDSTGSHLELGIIHTADSLPVSTSVDNVVGGAHPTAVARSLCPRRLGGEDTAARKSPLISVHPRFLRVVTRDL